MPWIVEDVDKHKAGLTDAQKKKWVKVANSALASCEAKKGTDCEGKAVRIASAAVQESGVHRTVGEWLRELVESAQELLAGKVDLGEALDLSHDQVREMLRGAIAGDSPKYNVWVRDIYDTYLVYNDDTSGKTYKRTYVIDAETAAVTLGEPTEVIGQMTWVPVSEAAILESDCIPLVEKAVRKDGTVKIKLIQPGWGASGYYPAEVLERDGPQVFPAGTHMFWDHPTETEERERPERSLRDLAAVLQTPAKYDGTGPAGAGLYAEAKVRDSFKGSLEELAPHIGTSIRAWGQARDGEAEGRQGKIVEKITQGRSCDFVTTPGAGGQVLQLFEAARQKPAPTTQQQEGKVVTEQEAQELRDKNAALTAENARLKEGQLLREARDFVTATLAGREMPDLTRARLIETLAAKPVIKDGKLDETAYKIAIEAAATAELEYLAKATGAAGAGAITGMGTSAPSDGTVMREAYKTMYLREGKPLAEAEKLAALAVQGR